MDIRSFLRRNILSPGAARRVHWELNPSPGLRTRVNALRGMAWHADRKDSSVENYSLSGAGDLRSVVESRFMRMDKLHDRIRAEILASHSPKISLPRSA